MKYEFSELLTQVVEIVNSRSVWLQSSSLYSTEVRGIVNCISHTDNLAFPVAANFVARLLNSHLPDTCLLTPSSLSRNVQSQCSRVQLLHVECLDLI